MKRVIDIVRVSTAGQVGEDKYGVDRQRHDIEQPGFTIKVMYPRAPRQSAAVFLSSLPISGNCQNVRPSRS